MDEKILVSDLILVIEATGNEISVMTKDVERVGGIVLEGRAFIGHEISRETVSYKHTLS